MYVLGLYPDGDYFKVALLFKSGRKIKITLLNEYKKDILDLNKLKRTLISETSYKDEAIEVASALGSEEVFIRSLTLPLRGFRSVKKALPFQSELAPFFLGENKSVFTFFKRQGKGTKVTLYGFLDMEMESHIQNLKTLGFDTDWVSTAPHALMRFAESFVLDANTYLVLHFGWESSFLVFVSEKEVVSFVVIPQGLKHIVDAFKTDHRDIEEIDHDFIKEEIESSLSSAASEKNKSVLESLKHQINRAWKYLEGKDERFNNLEGIIYTGYADYIKPFMESLEEICVKELSITPHLDFKIDKLSSFAIEIGLALDVLEADKRTLQLRSGKFFIEKQRKRMKKIVLLVASSLFLMVAISFASMKVYFTKREDIALQKFKNIARLGNEGLEEYPRLNKRFISKEDMAVEIGRLLAKSREVNKQGLFLTPPLLVSDCLSWLSGILLNEIVLQDFSYEIIEYPHVENPKATYSILCKIQFLAKDYAEAVSVKERIMTPPEGFFLGEEVTLQEKNGAYEVVCLLQEKDKLL